MSSTLLRSCILLICLAPLFSSAQVKGIRFNKITGMNGIFLGKINSISQDKEGAMWFSDQTNLCVTMYDGNRMIRYMHDEGDTNSLGGNYPEWISVDSSGYIWIGFYGFGLDRFDPATQTFQHFRHDPNNPQSISNDTVSNVLIDHNNNVWVGTHQGLNLFDRSTSTFKRFNHDPADPTSLSHRKVRALYEDRQGTIWVGTGFVWDLNNQGGLNRFDQKSGTFTRYLHEEGNPNSLVSNPVRAIFEDSQGHLWIGTMGDGLHTLDRSTGKIIRHPYNPKDKDHPGRPPVNTITDHITFITEDAEQGIWIGTYSNGLMRYDPKTKKATHYIGSKSIDTGFKDGTAWAAFPSTGGWLWISTQEANLYKVDLYHANIIHNTSLGESFLTFPELDRSILWYVTNDGLYRKDLSNGKIRLFQNDPTNPRSLSNNWPRRISRDQDGTIWISTSGGLNRYDEKTQSFTRYVKNINDPTSLSWNDVSGVLEDSRSNFWVSTFGGGLNLLNRKTGAFQRFMKSDKDSTSIGGDFVTAILEGESNDLWIGSWEKGGVSRMDYTTHKFKRYLPGISVLEIKKDSKGNIWVASISNIYLYDQRLDNFFNYTTGSVPLTFNEARSMIIDRQDNLWVFALSGVIRINKEKNLYIIYGKENGFKAEDYPFGSAKLLDNGEIQIDTWTGYYNFNPENLTVPQGRQILDFNNIFINGELIIPGKSNLLTAPLKNTKEIHLAHYQNAFSFTFSSIDYSPVESKLYFYKLEPFDEHWKWGDPNDQLYYFNVPPGNYTLKINATNTLYGVSTERELAIIISPPWWKSWWAYCLFGLGILGLGYSIHRYLKMQVLKAERERTHAHELAQAREIEKAYNQLKNTQNQLIQAEKMASLGELTAGIAHEIQNPLNFINNFAEVNAELIDELNEEISAQHYDELPAIAKTIKENEQKIIFHGKRADGIVKGMLQHSRSGSGQKEPTDINALADEYLRLAYHGLRAKDKTFNAVMNTDFDNDIGLINVVPQDIGRVILNLITNAFYAVTEKSKSISAQNFTPSNTDSGYVPTVTVKTKHHVAASGSMGLASANSNYIEISVSDNGSGIPENLKDKIFQPFFTTKSSGQGTGLGLSLSYDIVKAHGGEIQVHSQEGGGTEFVVMLPG